MKLYTTLLSVYYLVIAAVISFWAADTVFQGSILIGRGTGIRQLQSTKQQLARQQFQLTQQIDAATTLSSLQDSQALINYEPITNPVVVTARTEVASR